MGCGAILLQSIIIHPWRKKGGRKRDEKIKWGIWCNEHFEIGKEDDSFLNEQLQAKACSHLCSILQESLPYPKPLPVPATPFQLSLTFQNFASRHFTFTKDLRQYLFSLTKKKKKKKSKEDFCFHGKKQKSHFALCSELLQRPRAERRWWPRHAPSTGTQGFSITASRRQSFWTTHLSLSFVHPF